MNTYEQIVREMAAMDYEVAVYDDLCKFCGGFMPYESYEATNHEPACLRLRARRAVEFDGRGGVMHAQYDQKTGTFPCCGKTPAETAVNDLMTLDPVGNPVTCSGGKS